MLSQRCCQSTAAWCCCCCHKIGTPQITAMHQTYSLTLMTSSLEIDCGLPGLPGLPDPSMKIRLLWIVVGKEKKQMLIGGDVVTSLIQSFFLT